MKTQFHSTRKRHGPAAMLTAILVAFMLAPAFGQVPEFGPLQSDYFELGLDPHFPEYWAIMFPTLVDIDVDGDLDLFVGENWNQGGANIWLLDFYRNEGDSNCPDFQLEGSFPFGIPDSSRWLKFIDINGNGLPDLFAQKHGELYCILNTGNPEAPLFESRNIMNTPFGLDGSGILFFTPVFADLDDDGDFDVFATGRTGGHFLYQENIGTSEAPLFGARQEDPFGLSLPATPQGPIFPALADWDCDGDIDIINTQWNIDIRVDDYNAYFHENKYDELGYTHFEPGVFIGHRFIVTQGDLDGDGDLDALAFENYSRNISTFCVTPPTAAFTSSQTEVNLEYAFTNTSTFRPGCTGVQWLWDFGDGITSEEEHPGHLFPEPGSYDVCLTVEDVAGRDTACIPTEVISGTTRQYRQDAIRLYPNPARDFLYLKFKEDVSANTARVEIFDTWGRLFRRVQLGYSSAAEPLRVDIASLPDGLYLVKVAVRERFYIGDFVKMK